MKKEEKWAIGIEIAIMIIIVIFVAVVLFHDVDEPKCLHYGCEFEPASGSLYCYFHDPYRNKSYSTGGGNSYSYSSNTSTKNNSSSTSTSNNNSSNKGLSSTKDYSSLECDPDDYDSPEEYADDAWEVDFDDWDDAYDYWEDY